MPGKDPLPPFCLADRTSVSHPTRCVEVITAEGLNRHCFCLAVEPSALRAQLNALLADSGSEVRLAESHDSLFSALPIFVPEAILAQLAEAVRALSAIALDPAYVRAVMAWSLPVAAHDPGSPGGLLGFDFHLGPDGPRLIEINTNPGGLLLNALLSKGQRLCLPGLSVPAAVPDAPAAAVTALLEEWRLQGGVDPRKCVVIVDVAPKEQYLYAEFVLFQRALEARGYPAAVCDPSELHYANGALWLGAQQVGFVYNRLTDFALGTPAVQPIRLAYLQRAVALSPHPRAHAVWADKRNLSLLCQKAFLAGTGLSASQQAKIAAVVPATTVMTPENRDALWARRDQLFFKPASGFGSRASYRGDKLTHGTWKQMAGTAYVAQERVPPSERHTAPGAPPLKVDIRCYAYGGLALLYAARLYRGQTTNFRTPGGGFAPVLALVEKS